MSKKSYKIIQEKDKALLVETVATQLVGWVPKQNGKGEDISDEEVCAIVNRKGVPESIYLRNGLTCRQSLMKEISFDNLHYDDKNNVIIKKDGKKTPVARSYIEQPDMLKKTLFLPAKYAERNGFTEGTLIYLTTRQMQCEVNRHFGQLKKEQTKKLTDEKKVKGKKEEKNKAPKSKKAKAR